MGVGTLASSQSAQYGSRAGGVGTARRNSQPLPRMPRSGPCQLRQGSSSPRSRHTATARRLRRRPESWPPRPVISWQKRPAPAPVRRRRLASAQVRAAVRAVGVEAASRRSVTAVPCRARRSSACSRRSPSAAPVVVLSAGPGWGKTTLLAQWASRSRRPFAWVSVDENDNDPIVLLTYVAVALDRISPIDPSVFDALASPGVSVEGTVVPRLGAALATIDERGRAGSR